MRKQSLCPTAPSVRCWCNILFSQVNFALQWQALFRRAQLKALVDIHSSSEGMMGGYLTNEEISIIRGALDLSGKKALQAMTPLDKVEQADYCTACVLPSRGSTV